MPDPRRARGQRYAWSLLLTLIAAALASGQQHIWGIAHWAALHAEEIMSLLALDGVRFPSVSTLYRAVQGVDVAALQAHLPQDRLRSEETTYGITSLGWQQADAAQLEHLWRGHWTIENRSHYVRDETMGEDRGRVHRGHTPEALATLRNSLIALMRAESWPNIAAALRHYGSAVVKAFTLLGVSHP